MFFFKHFARDELQQRKDGTNVRDLFGDLLMDRTDKDNRVLVRCTGEEGEGEEIHAYIHKRRSTHQRMRTENCGARMNNQTRRDEYSHGHNQTRINDRLK